jgi:hypothetical protein
MQADAADSTREQLPHLSAVYDLFVDRTGLTIREVEAALAG